MKKICLIIPSLFVVAFSATSCGEPKTKSYRELWSKRVEYNIENVKTRESTRTFNDDNQVIAQTDIYFEKATEPADNETEVKEVCKIDYVYTYDEKGNLKSEDATVIPSNASITLYSYYSYYYYTYGADGTIREKIIYTIAKPEAPSTNATQKVGYYNTCYYEKFDDLGRVTYETYYYTNATTNSKIRKYDEYTFEYSYERDFVNYSSALFTYFSRSSANDFATKIVVIGTNTLDKNGNILTENLYGGDGFNSQLSYTYDKYGCPVYCEGYEVLEDNKTYYLSSEISYYKNNSNKVEQSETFFYDISRDKIMLSCFIQCEYDEYGRTIKTVGNNTHTSKITKRYIDGVTTYEYDRLVPIK